MAGLLITNGWLVEEVDSCTCGAGPTHHEAGCGQIPLTPADSILEYMEAHPVHTDPADPHPEPTC